MVSTQWLKGKLSSGLHKHRVLDASWGISDISEGPQDFVREHIPGALYFDLNRCVNPLPQLPRNLPNPACFMEYARTLGISKDTHLVLYDRGSMMAAARAWWNFRAYGHENVSVLDGGLMNWKTAGQAIESGPMSLPEKMGDFEVNVREEYMKNFEDIQKVLLMKNCQIVDARESEHFAGLESEPTTPTKVAYEGLNLETLDAQRQQGHIPGAINVQSSLVVDEGTNCFLPKDELKKVFRSAGVDLSKPLVTMCYNGNAASLLALAANVCGHEDVSVYYGSWTEYGYRTDPQGVVTGNKSGG